MTVDWKIAAVSLALALAGAGAASAATPAEQHYLDNCAACHQPDGAGIPGAFPALAGDPFVKEDPAKVAEVILNGRGGMPAFREDLSDEVISDAITYIRGSWGNKATPVTKEAVHAVRDGPPPDANRPLQAH